MLAPGVARPGSTAHDQHRGAAGKERLAHHPRGRGAVANVGPHDPTRAGQQAAPEPSPGRGQARPHLGRRSRSLDSVAGRDPGPPVTDKKRRATPAQRDRPPETSLYRKAPPWEEATP